MKMFSDCSGPCETCANNIPGVSCMAGHGDDHYVLRKEKMPNTNNRNNLKNLIGLLSDGHQSVAQQACNVNDALIKLDKVLVEGGNSKMFRLRVVLNKLEDLLDLMDAQERRAARTREEVAEILKNIQII